MATGISPGVGGTSSTFAYLRKVLSLGWASSLAAFSRAGAFFTRAAILQVWKVEKDHLRMICKSFGNSGLIAPLLAVFQLCLLPPWKSWGQPLLPLLLQHPHQLLWCWALNIFGLREMRMGKLCSSQPWIFVCVGVPITLYRCIISVMHFVLIHELSTTVSSIVVQPGTHLVTGVVVQALPMPLTIQELGH